MSNNYETVSGLVGRIRNARYGEMVRHLEELIDSGAWRDYTTPVGTHFEFLELEFDYFLLAQDVVEPQVVRAAYAHAADIDGLPKLEMRLADITGRGKKPDVRGQSNSYPGFRRARSEVAEAFRGDPSGAAQRIAAADATRASAAYVSENAGRIAADPDKRAKFERGEKITRSRDQRWQVDYAPGSSTAEAAEAIARKLLKDADLAREVQRILCSAAAEHD